MGLSKKGILFLALAGLFFAKGPLLYAEDAGSQIPAPEAESPAGTPVLFPQSESFSLESSGPPAEMGTPRSEEDEEEEEPVKNNLILDTQMAWNLR